MASKLSSQEEALIVEMYQAHVSGTAIAKLLKYDCGTIYSALRRHSVRIRPPEEAHRLPCNVNYFDQIDTEEKAYWLGFIVADGCVSGTITIIGLSSSDIGHLEKFRAAVQSKRKISVSQAGIAAQFAIDSSHTVEALGNLGVHPRKSFTATAPVVREDLERHLWRGIFDGDGCVFKGKDSYWGVTLVGSKDIVEGFSKFVATHCKFDGARSYKGGHISKHASIWQWATHGTVSTTAVLQLLYEDSSVYLERKYARYLQSELERSHAEKNNK